MRTDSQTSRRLRDRFREETSAAILTAAEAEIAEVGLHTARMERIAARAGVSVGTLYNHFRDRSALLQALFDARTAQLSARMDEALAPVQGAPLETQVVALLGAMAEHGRRHGRLFAALTQAHEGPSRLKPPERARVELSARARKLLAAGAAGGEVREDPDGVFADALVALSRLVLAHAIDGTAHPGELRSLAALYTRGVRP